MINISVIFAIIFYTSLITPSSYAQKNKKQKDESAVNSVAFSNDGKVLATGSGEYSFTGRNIDNLVRLWDAQTGKLKVILKGHEGAVNQVIFSPKGNLLASISGKKTIFIWDAKTGDFKFEIKTGQYSISSMAFSPDGKLLAAASDAIGRKQNAVQLIDIASQKLTKSFGDHGNTIDTLAFSPDGKSIVTGAQDGNLRIWNIKTKKIIKAVKVHKSSIKSAVFSPDSQLIATGGFDRDVKLLNSKAGLLHSSLEHKSFVVSLAFSPDGKLLASASLDKTVNLWDIESGQLISALKGHKSVINNVTFSPDGKRLATASKDGTAVIWSLNNTGAKLSLSMPHKKSQTKTTKIKTANKATVKKQAKAEHPESKKYRSLVTSAYKYQKQKRYKEAETLFKKALEFYKKEPGEKHLDLILTLSSLVELYEKIGRYDDVIKLLNYNLKIHLKVHGKYNPITDIAVERLAGIYQRLGNREAASSLRKKY